MLKKSHKLRTIGYDALRDNGNADIRDATTSLPKIR